MQYPNWLLQLFSHFSALRDLVRSFCGCLLVDAAFSLNITGLSVQEAFFLYTALSLLVIFQSAVMTSLFGDRPDFWQNTLIFAAPYLLIFFDVIPWSATASGYVVLAITLMLLRANFPGALMVKGRGTA